MASSGISWVDVRRVSRKRRNIFISGIRRLLKPLNYAVVPMHELRACAWGAFPISGSFAPFHEYACVGTRENYFVHDGYKHRLSNQFFDDTPNTDQAQLEVYLFAKEVSDSHKLATVCDIGCGSGYKLVTYFGKMKTVGLDLPRTCEWLQRKYPDRLWLESDFLRKPDFPTDLVIAADVIEHLPDPDRLMRYLASLQPRFIVLSTPERNLLREGTHNGPPCNPAHVREWNFTEFEAYVSEYFEIVEHFVSSAPQATQCVLCKPTR